ncbi:DNA-binding transcriptional LysR family regulator [Novosphingobium sp. 1529]|uniref:LysR family transcriptional regulator n=1 Tax=Novosphingobium TaxID=165696 RepID=UPI00078996E6|nr:LysR family transcriptional regulator [Novosphingobium capsulatum]WQD93109.1 LysR family transcriptional regulator [Novosphingobium capsulatum]
MQLRHLRYFVALARQRHFARAAAECGVSQPTLSAGLVALEQDLGKRLVERDRRFIDLTAQGQAMLPWAEQILGAMGSMAQAVAATAAPLAGRFRLAAIPAALPLVGRFGDALLGRYPGLHLAVHQATSRVIEQDLQALSCDAGLTYLDHEPPANVIAVPLAQERYLFVTHGDAARESGAAMDWAEAAAMPLCLLHQGMQYRRILDAQFAARGLALAPRAVADSYVALLSLVQSGRFATIIPDSYAALLTGLDWAAIQPMEGVETARRLGLVVLDRQPMGPLALAALDVARALAA